MKRIVTRMVPLTECFVFKYPIRTQDVIRYALYMKLGWDPKYLNPAPSDATESAKET